MLAVAAGCDPWFASTCVPAKQVRRGGVRPLDSLSPCKCAARHRPPRLAVPGVPVSPCHGLPRAWLDCKNATEAKLTVRAASQQVSRASTQAGRPYSDRAAIAFQRPSTDFEVKSTMGLSRAKKWRCAGALPRPRGRMRFRRRALPACAVVLSRPEA